MNEKIDCNKCPIVGLCEVPKAMHPHLAVASRVQHEPVDWSVHPVTAESCVLTRGLFDYNHG